jgi:protein-disulfide isomerase
MRRSSLFASLLVLSSGFAALPVAAQQVRVGISEIESTAASSRSGRDDAAIGYLPSTGADLLALIEGCDEESCMSYVYGVISGTTVYAVLAEKPSPFCAAREVDGDDIRDAVTSTLHDTPPLADAPAALAILTAFGRYWPCTSPEQVQEISDQDVVNVEPEAITALIESGDHAIELGDAHAGPDRTIVVFSDPNCPHCRRFRQVAEDLATNGWRVMIHPVSIVSPESAGYGAVQIALRDLAPEAARSLYEADAGDVADITIAMKIAEQAGASTKDLLTAIARSGAYDAVERNNLFFTNAGATGAPSWIIGTSLYSGYLGADAIEDLASSMEGDEEGVLDAEVLIDTKAE